MAFSVLAYLAGNGVKACVTPNHELAPYADKLVDVLKVMEQAGVDKNTLTLALSVMPTDEKVRLSKLDGAIRRVIDVTDGFDMTRVYHEISQSYNTTAAGGNASLMATA